MDLCIQDFDHEPPEFLNEVISAASKTATSGGAAFAFATVSGIQLLLDDENFTKFLQRGGLELIVGTDAITSDKALQLLHDSALKFPRLVPRAFKHERGRRIFHPKFCWFRQGQEGVAIVGSGNLTFEGMRRNWEAFTVLKLNSVQVDSVEASWLEWRRRWGPYLHEVDEPEILEVGKKNRQRSLVCKKAVRKAKLPPVPIEDDQANLAEKAEVVGDPDVLVAEVPKSGNRWNQANFSKEVFENYFRARQGSKRRLVLQEIKSDGTLGPLENRPAVSVKSQNYRIELRGAANLKYPKGNKPPIVVFVRFGYSDYAYRLLMPNRSYYNGAAKYLDRTAGDRTRAMRRQVNPKPAVLALWPKAPRPVN